MSRVMSFALTLAAGLAVVLAGAEMTHAQSLPEIASLPLAPNAPALQNPWPLPVGDVDADGVVDFALWYQNDTFEIRSGGDGAAITTIALEGGSTRWTTGPTGIGDVSGDGRGDVVVVESSPPFDFVGSATLRAIDGSTGANLWSTPAVLGLDPNGHTNFGAQLRAIGDQDGDGVDDVLMLVRMRFNPTQSVLGGPSVGLIEIRSGVDGSLVHHFSTEGGPSATSLAVIGDIDGDGIEDFALGAPGESTVASRAGAIAVVRGGTFDFVQFILGAEAFQEFGTQVASIGDHDGDGTPDIAVFSAQSDLPVIPSRPIYEVFSGATFANIHRSEFPTGTSFYRFLGGAAPDINGDGVGDPALWREGTGSGPAADRAVLDGASGGLLRLIGPHAVLTDDANGDGLGDIATWRSTGSTSSEIVVTANMAAETFGSGTGAVLLRWETDPVLPRRGILVIEGGPAHDTALIGASTGLNPGGGLSPLLLDASPSAVVFTGFLPLDAAGEVRTGLDLREPGLAGTVLYVQALVGQNGDYTNGLELLFGN